MKQNKQKIRVVLIVVAICAGCQSSLGVSGGTEGELIVGESWRVGDIQVTAHRVLQVTGGERSVPVGFGITSANGTFRLIRHDGGSALWLEPGVYAYTFESVGPEPKAWPEEYYDPLRSPVRVEWTAGQERLKLEIPEPSTTNTAAG